MKPLFPIGTSFLFIGDSITDAFRKPDEQNDAYRMGNGYAFLIASQLRVQNPKANWDFNNRGVSGHRLQDLENRWESNCLALNPDVLSILIGVNETINHFHGEDVLDATAFGALYAQLLQRVLSRNPATKLVLCEPFLLPCGMVGDGWCEHLRERAAVVRQLACEFDATFVALQAAFNRVCDMAPPHYWAYDGGHPTAAGHYVLAQEWLEAVKANELFKA